MISAKSFASFKRDNRTTLPQRNNIDTLPLDKPDTPFRPRLRSCFAEAEHRQVVVEDTVVAGGILEGHTPEAVVGLVGGNTLPAAEEQTLGVAHTAVVVEGLCCNNRWQTSSR